MFDAFANQFGRAGMAAGGLAGGVLGSLSDILSAPRRGVVAGLNALGADMPDQGNQAVAKWTGMNPDDLLTHGLGLGLDMALDPLTYVGGFAGRLGGRAAGGALDAAAMARGPGYAGGAEKLAQAMSEGGSTSALAQKLAGSADASRVLAELPEGSELLSGSNNALAFKTPHGDVARIAGGDALPASRPAVGQMLQPTHNVEVGPWRVERVPWADQVGDRDLFAQNYRPLTTGLREQGLHPADMHPGNIGTVGGGPAQLIDPGAAVPLPGRTVPTAPSIQAQQPGRFTNSLLDMLGADHKLQSHLGGTLSAAPAKVYQAAAEAPGGLQTADRLQAMRGFIDPESLASGATRTYSRPSAEASQLAEQLGIGTHDAANNTLSLNAGLHRNLSHADKIGAPGVPPPFMQTVPGRGENLVLRHGADLPGVVPTADELSTLRALAQEIGPSDIASIHSPRDFWSEAASRLSPSPSPLASAAPGNLPVESTHGSLQSLLQMLHPDGFGMRDAALIGGAGGVGYGLGNSMWGQR